MVAMALLTVDLMERALVSALAEAAASSLLAYAPSSIKCGVALLILSSSADFFFWFQNSIFLTSNVPWYFKMFLNHCYSIFLENRGT